MKKLIVFLMAVGLIMGATTAMATDITDFDIDPVVICKKILEFQSECCEPGEGLDKIAPCYKNLGDCVSDARHLIQVANEKCGNDKVCEAKEQCSAYWEWYHLFWIFYIPVLEFGDGTSLGDCVSVMSQPAE